MNGVEVIVVDPGNNVVCDLCNADFTSSDVSGGFLFMSKGVCPTCAPEFEKKIIGFGEQQFIRARCPSGMSFANWIRNVIR